MFEDEDLRDYKESIDRTDVIETPHKVNSSDRPRNTAKYAFLTENFGELESEKEESDEEYKSEEEEKKRVQAFIFSQVI